MRRAAGWVMLVLGVLVTGVWLASGWCSVFWQVTRHSAVQLSCGTAGFVRSSTPWPPDAATTFPHGFQMLWRPYLEEDRKRFDYEWDALLARHSGTRAGRTPSETITQLVLWPIPPILWITGALLIRSGVIARRRAMVNACTTCGYPRTGITNTAACPECGKGTAPA